MSSSISISTANNLYTFDYVNCFEKPLGLVLERQHDKFQDLFYMYLKMVQSYNISKFENDNVFYTMNFNNAVRWIIEDKLKLQIDVQDIQAADIHKYIKSQLDLSRPVLVTGNLRELSYTKHYKVGDWGHLFLLNGYDEEKELYEIVDGEHKKPEGNVFEYGAFSMDYFILERLYNSMKTKYELGFAGVIYSSGKASDVNEKELLLDCLDLFIEGRSKQPYKEVDYVDEVLNRIRNGEAQNSQVNNFDPTNMIDFVFTRGIKYKEVFFKTLISFLKRHNCDEKLIESLEEKVAVLIGKWSKILNISLISYHLKNSFNINDKIDEAKVIEEEIVSITKQIRSKMENKVVRLVQTKAREQIKNLNELPIPNRSLVNYEKYNKYLDQAMVRHCISLQGTRGCPYKCAYCHKIWPKSHVYRSAEHIFNELKIYYDMGVRRFSFIDDIFNLNVENSSKFFKMVIDNKLDINLFFPNGVRADLLTKDYMDLMVEAGTVSVAFALETASARLQKLIGKNLDLEKFQENLEYMSLKYPNVITELFTMHGFPTETQEEAMMTLEFIKSMKWIHFPYLFILKIFENTDMAKLAIANGISIEDIEKSKGLHFTQLPFTLPFDRSFTLKYQTDFFNNYFMDKERLLHVLPYQMKILTEQEIIQKYNSYLPTEIASLEDLYKFAKIEPEQMQGVSCLCESKVFVPEIHSKMKKHFGEKKSAENALRVLLLDLSQHFNSENEPTRQHVEPPLGHMYLMTYLNQKLGEKVNGRIAKSRVDFDSYEELKDLLEDFKPDVIGIRTLSYYKDFFHVAVEAIRKFGFNGPILTGGPYASSEYESILKDKNIDLVLLGEGELTFCEVIEKVIANNRKIPKEDVLKEIPGIVFRTKEDMSLSNTVEKVIFIDMEEGVSEELGSETPNSKCCGSPEAVIKGTLNSDSSDCEFRPNDQVESRVADIWKECLQVEHFDKNVNFFDLGGNSLTAIKMIASILKEFNIEIYMEEFFNNLTLEKIIEYVKKNNENNQKNIWKTIEKVEKREFYPLSSSQKRIFVIEQLEKGSTAYNITFAMEFANGIDRKKLENVFRIIFLRHESLRTYFSFVGDEVVQIVSDNTQLDIKYMTAKDEGDYEDITREFIKPFDLFNAPLMRVGVVGIMGSQKELVIIDIHHIIADGLSVGIILKEFSLLYRDKALKELNYQFKDFAVWQQKIINSDELSTQEEYWLKMFKGDIPKLNMPLDFKRPALQSFKGDNVLIKASAGLTEKVNKLAKEKGMTVFNLLFAAYNILLYKYTGQNDIIAGIPVGGRGIEEFQDLVGMFVNTIPLRNLCNDALTFNAFLENVKNNTLEAFKNQDYQFEMLVEKLEITRDISRNPLFDTMFSFLDIKFETLQLDNYKIEPFEIKSKTSRFDLLFEVREINNEFNLNLVYCTTIFNRSTIERLGRYFINILEEIVENQNICIRDIQMLSEADRKQLLYDFNNTDVGYSENKTINQLFEEMAIKAPDKQALVFSKDSGIKVTLTYMELNEKANRVAWALKQLGAGKGSYIGILMDRSIDMVVGLMGILKSGAVYVPIEPYLPDARILAVLNSVDIRYIITDCKSLNRLGNLEGLPLKVNNIICLDELANDTLNTFTNNISVTYRSEILMNPVKNLPRQIESDELAYIIFTSGSTGNPKGVAVAHKPVINLIEWVNGNFNVGHQDKILFITSISFDLSVYDIFGILAAGGTIYIASSNELLEPKRIINLIIDEGITFWDSAPQALGQIVPYFEQMESKIQNSKLRLVFLSGDWIPVKLPDIMKKFINDVKVIGLGGATEATVWSNCYLIGKVEDYWSSIPYGKPIQNSKYFILDKRMEPCPIGVPGDLYIGGKCLASGYINDLELTKSKFLDSPFDKGEVIYKTGDVARWFEDGNIEFLGRNDFQVKVRGFRVELGDIESVLKQHEMVEDAVVESVKDKQGNNYLTAYYVLKEQSDQKRQVIAEILKEHIAEQLPPYMVPSYMVKLDYLPLTSNGKLDRNALPDARDVVIEDTGKKILPKNDIEIAISDIWKDVLGIETLSVEDNFFDKGGNSVLIIQTNLKLQEKFKVDIPVMNMFRYPTISMLQKYISGLISGTDEKQETKKDNKLGFDKDSVDKKLKLMRRK